MGDVNEPVALPLASVAAGCGALWGKLEAFPVGLVENSGKGKEGDRVLETGPERDGELRWPAGLLGGGGVGTAAVFSRRLDDRDKFESKEERGGVPASSAVSACDLLSVLACDCRLGGGAGFLDIDAGF